MTMRHKHKSDYVAQVMREIRQFALKEQNEEWRSRLWRWYYRLLHGETEIYAMVVESELLCLLEIAMTYGRLPENWKEELAKFVANMEAREDTLPPVIDDIDDDDIPPRQLRLFDD
jgi:hypothetical protein